MLDPEEFANEMNRRVLEASSLKLVEVFKDRVNQQDPSINWDKVEFISDIENKQFEYKSSDPEIETRIQNAVQALNSEIKY